MARGLRGLVPFRKAGPPLFPPKIPCDNPSMGILHTTLVLPLFSLNPPRYVTLSRILILFVDPGRKMRQTLRRSCAACAKSKHSCDLGTPRCSRCIRRNVRCEYANQPLSAPGPSTTHSRGAVGHTRGSPGSSGPLMEYAFGALDPFESYPQTRLPRDHVQRLIHSCM